MDVSSIIESLNDTQREAVTATEKSLLVLAGAGSGKTRVLVHRVAWLLKAEGISPRGILAVTFTNKAAKEMCSRIEALLKISTRGMWVGTFHGLTHRLLRHHASDADLPDTFQILDSDDQYRVIRRLLKVLNLDESRWSPRQIQHFINAQKDEGKRAKHMLETGDPYQSVMLQVYTAYEELCQRSGLVDFAELLLRAHELLRDNSDLLDHYKQRFHYVLVDEFQDTNTIQYAWLRLLTTDRENLFVVGDDDQSIYGWRGAKIENIHHFQKHYPRHRLVRLEQNYRSTGNILAAANALIAYNEGRLGKKLWTEDSDGEPISLYSSFNEQEEALFVIERIKQWIEEGNLRCDAAILYRSNAQSRLFEERLVTAGIPYRVYGGLRFFDRAEIKNVLAYMRLTANRHDDPSFERIHNTPTRGIGARTMDFVRERARLEELSLWRAAENLCEGGTLTGRAANALKRFLDLVNEMADASSELTLHERTKRVVESSNLIALYQKEGEKGEARIENLKELVNAARQFENQEDSDIELNELDQFLSHAALESGDTQADAYDDFVQLMTLHSAKGLEFKLVFVVGMEEGLFPSQQSLEDPGRLEEERRLCYVGMTRAMQKLYFTYAESRRLYGRDSYPRPSRFLRELPREQVEEVRMGAQIGRPATVTTPVFSETPGKVGYRLGQRVLHKKFGEGVVLQSEGSGTQARVQINFENIGLKWLVLSYANL
ncbi:MAG: DNA helicase II, partial [Methylococcales bacterium]